MTTVQSNRGVALVVGDNEYAGLQVVRSLGRLGIRVELVCFSHTGITRSSRYVCERHAWGHPLLDADRFRASLVEYVERRHIDLVIPTSDEALVGLMPIRARITAASQFAAPDERAFAATANKENTLRLASAVGIPIPKSRLVSADSETVTIVKESEYPLVLKPTSSVYEGASGRNEVAIVDSRDELVQMLPDMLRSGPVLVQDYCPGVGVGLNVLANGGRVCAAFQHRRLHEPLKGGASSYRMSEPLDGQLLEHARRFCHELQWTGLAMFEFKRDTLSGQHTLMEVNGRLWGSVSLAIQSGVDFPRLLYELHVHGKTSDVFSYRTPFYVRHTLRDVYWLQANLRAPRNCASLMRVPMRQVLAEFGNIARLQEGFDLESLSDPLPGVVAWRCLAGNIIGDVADKLAGRRRKRRAATALKAMRRKLQTSRSNLRRAKSFLFVCTGNINRSAVAAQRMVALNEARGAERCVASVGTSAEVDRSTSSVSCDVASRLGVELSGHRSAPFHKAMVDDFDLIIVMDSGHLDYVLAAAPQARDKVFLLSTFDPEDDAAEIADPFGEDRDTFDAVYRRIVRCVDHLTQSVLGETESHVPVNGPRSL